LRSADISVFGAGYVGLVTGACLAKSGHRVTVLDVDRTRLAPLANGRAPFFEPNLDATLTEALSAGRLEFAHPDDARAATGSASRDRFIFVAVGTPATPAGFADLRYVRGVIDRIEASAPSGVTVITKSTVPPGTGTPFAARLATRDIGYVSNPEFLREGSAVEDWYHTDRIVLGGKPEHVAAVASLYADIDAPIVRCDITSAELVKYASNAFLATKISFVNEIASLCEITGADVTTVAHAVGMDHRIGGAFMSAGIGYGGSCFPKDTRALDFLATVNGYDFHLLKAVIEVNARQRLLPVIALKRHLGSLEDKLVAVLGLTFKPDTDDTREAPAAEIIDLLLAEGADVRGHDPMGRLDVADPRYRFAESLSDAVTGAHAVVVCTEWTHFAHADWAALAGLMAPDALLFDGRNCLNPASVRAAGLNYVAVGRR
jgi:UDPglucose 6-dehydrogenase